MPGEIDYVYCRAWNWKLWMPGGAITEDEARQRFATGGQDDWFSAVAPRSSGDIPSFVLEIVPRASVILARFYSPSRSQHLEYLFRRIDERMFMTEATQWFYPDKEQHYGLSKATLVETFVFRPDGVVERTVDDSDSPDIDKMSYRDVDVSAHWEDVPEFGEWARFGREDR